MCIRDSSLSLSLSHTHTHTHTHTHSPGPELTPPPINPRQSHYSIKTLPPEGDDVPLTPPPRPAHTLAYRMASSPVLPNIHIPPSGSQGRPTRSLQGSQPTSVTGLINITESCEPSRGTTPNDSTHNRLILANITCIIHAHIHP